MQPKCRKLAFVYYVLHMHRRLAVDAHRLTAKHRCDFFICASLIAALTYTPSVEPQCALERFYINTTDSLLNHKTTLSNSYFPSFRVLSKSCRTLRRHSHLTVQSGVTATIYFLAILYLLVKWLGISTLCTLKFYFDCFTGYFCIFEQIHCALTQVYNHGMNKKICRSAVSSFVSH